MNNSPIGIFDSGLGGLTVARAVIDQLPHEEIVYIGDTANTPYGPKPIAQVRQMALNVMDQLVDQGVKMLVIACNTASAAVLADARERYEKKAKLPVVEVIRPAVRRALASTKTNRVGVIATRATVNSGVYQDALGVNPAVKVSVCACPRFVEFVESGINTGDELIEIAKEYLQPIAKDNVDTLVLGCTHYPMLSGVISYVMGPEVTLVSSSQEAASDVYKVLIDQNLARDPHLASPEHRFLSTAPAPNFAKLAQRFLGPMVCEVQTL